MIQYKSKNVTVFQSSLFETTSTVIETDDIILVVDPTWLPHEVESISNYVNSIRQCRPIYLIFTHSDYDHIIGYNAFIGAITVGSEELNKRADKEKIINEIKDFDDEYYLTRDYSIEYPIINLAIKEDNQVLKVGETTITFYKSKGHTDDGIFIIVEPLGVLLVGDYLSNIEIPFIYYSSLEYENTLLKIDKILQNHNIKLLVPGHGLITGEYDEIIRRQQESLKYIRELRNAVLNNAQKKIDDMIEGCLFPRFMKKCHYENRDIIKSELETNL